MTAGSALRAGCLTPGWLTGRPHYHPPRLPAAADGRWRYPVLAQTARSAGSMPPEEESGQGLAIVRRGFRAMLAGPPP
jgi:hypothetical protein